MIKALWLKNLNWIKENNQNKRKKPFSLYLKKQIQIYRKYPKQMSIKMKKILQDYLMLIKWNKFQINKKTTPKIFYKIQK